MEGLGCILEIEVARFVVDCRGGVIKRRIDGDFGLSNWVITV